MLILDLWGISFHAVVVFGLGKTLYLNLFVDTVFLTLAECNCGNKAKNHIHAADGHGSTLRVVTFKVYQIEVYLSTRS